MMSGSPSRSRSSTDREMMWLRLPNNPNPQIGEAPPVSSRTVGRIRLPVFSKSPFREPPNLIGREPSRVNSGTQTAELGVSVPHRLHPEITEEGELRPDPRGHGTHSERTGRTESKSDRRGALDDGSCSHAHRDSPGVRCGTRHRVHEGEERDSNRASICGPETKTLRSALLGAGTFRVDGCQKRRGDRGVHPAPEVGREVDRSAENSEIRVCSSGF